MRTGLLLGWVLLNAAGCGHADVEVLVDLPPDVKSARALANPPEVVVTVERVTQTSGGGACGHSPVCLVLIPIIAWQAIFPEQTDEVRITQGGKLHATGTYVPDGALIEGQLFDATSVHAATMLELPVLGRRILLERAHAPLGADGLPGVFVKTSVQAQVDLLGAYSSALVGETDGERRGQLLVEASTALEDEALPLVAARLADPAESDVARAAVIADACNRLPAPIPDEKGALPVGADVRTSLLRASATSAGVPTAIAGMVCATEGEGVPGVAATYAKILVAEACARPAGEALRTLSRVDALNLPLAPMVSGDVAACADLPARLMLERGVRLPVDPAELLAAVQLDSDSAAQLSQGLSPGAPAEREAFFARLARPAGKKDGQVAITALRAAPELVLTDAESAILARAYAAETPGVLSCRQFQAETIEYWATRSDPERTAARAALAGAGGDPIVLAAGSFGLGDRGMAPRLAAAIPAESDGAHMSFTVCSVEDLAGWALTTSGCTWSEVSTMGQAAKTAGATAFPGCAAWSR